MTRDDIIRLAREAGLATDDRGRPNGYAEYCNRLAHFATLVAAAEREECAEIADEYEYQLVAGSCARDIRARGESDAP